MSTRVSAIIVNYNSGTYARQCIESLLRQTEVELEIIIVDNASDDDSVAMLQQIFGERIHLIANTENLGFGRANNLGAARAAGEYLLLINPDTELCDPDAVRILAEFAGRSEIGIVGPEIHEPLKRKQYVLPRHTYPSQSKLRFKQRFENLPGDIAWILGACMMLRKAVYEELAGFDPDYFLYGEDIDICLRARLAGYEIGYCSAARITHVGGASERHSLTLDKYLRKKRGFFLFCRKHYDHGDVVRIARRSLLTAFLQGKRDWLSHALGRMSDIQYAAQRQRLEATRIIACDVLSGRS